MPRGIEGMGPAADSKVTFFSHRLPVEPSKLRSLGLLAAKQSSKMEKVFSHKSLSPFGMIVCAVGNRGTCDTS